MQETKPSRSNARRHRGRSHRTGPVTVGLAPAVVITVLSSLSELGALMMATMRANTAVGWTARILLFTTALLIGISALLLAHRESAQERTGRHRALSWCGPAAILALLAWSLVAAALPGTGN